MIEMSELISDPDFAGSISIIRETVALIEGAATTQQQRFDGISAIVQPATQADILTFAEEGERQGNWISVWCEQELRQGDGQDLYSDVIVYDGQYYRIAKAKRRDRNGFYRAWAKGFALKE